MYTGGKKLLSSEELRKYMHLRSDIENYALSQHATTCRSYKHIHTYIYTITFLYILHI